MILSPDLQALARAFDNAGHTLYLVGGCVRNALLGLPPSDYDLTGAALPELAAQLAQAAGFHAVIRSCALGTVEIQTDVGPVEYTPFRIDHYPPGGAHRPLSITFTESLLPDAQRRDFTLNALYYRLLTGELIDPLGGEADARAGVLRACAPSADQTLREDGLRLLRMARFGGELGFVPDEALRNAGVAHAHNLLDLSPSRLFGEWQRICLCDQKYPGFSPGIDKPLHALTLLHDCGLLRVLFPPLYEGVAVVQNSTYHAYDVFWHCLHAFAAAPTDVTLRTAALLHDIGKPRAAALHHGRMHGHDKIGLRLAAPLLPRLGMPNGQQRTVLALIEHHMYDLNGQAKDSTLRVRFATLGFDFVRQLIALRRADVVGSGRDSEDSTAPHWTAVLDAMIAQGAIDDINRLALDGNDIAAACDLSPGPMIGRIKQLLFQRCALTPSLNERKALLREARVLCRQLAHENAEN